MKVRFFIGSFTTFVLVGLVFLVLAVVLNWVAIDLLNGHSFYAPFIIISFLFVLKYYCYLWTKTIVPRFWRYVLANSLVTLASTVAITVLVEVTGFQGWLSTLIALGVFTLLRYFVLYSFKVIRRAPDPIADPVSDPGIDG